MNERIQRVLESLPTEIQGGIITSAQNRWYLCGVKSSAGYLILTREKAYFIVDFRYIEMATRCAQGVEVVLQEDLFTQIKEIFQKHGCEKIAMETQEVSVAQFAHIEHQLEPFTFVKTNELSRGIEKARQIKTPEELALMRKAAAMGDETFSYILTQIKVGKTEKEIALEMEFFIRKLGAEKVSFDFIVASGKNSSLPHGVPSDKPVASGEFITLDFGCIYQGYCSDMTRTIGVGKVSQKQMDVYALVKKAQQAALDVIQSGVACNKVDQTARKMIYEGGFEGYFGHGLGHCIGMDVHESPRCNETSPDTLQTNMVTSVEPGIYLPGEFGVRIEDCVVVTAQGYENLAKSEKELIIL